MEPVTDPDSSNDVPAAPEDEGHTEPPTPPAPNRPDSPQAPPRPTVPPPPAQAAPAPPPWERRQSGLGSPGANRAAAQDGSYPRPAGGPNYYGSEGSAPERSDEGQRGPAETERPSAPAAEKRQPPRANTERSGPP